MATDWTAPLDPSDHVEYVADFRGAKPLLEVGEKIATYTVDLSPEAIAAGLVVDEAGEFAHKLVDDDSAVEMWFTIDEEKRGDEAFVRGVKLGVIVTATTDSDPPRRRQRTWRLSAKQL